MEIDRALRHEFATKVGRTENLRSAQLWIRRHPEGLETRVVEFEDAMQTLTGLMNDSELDKSKFKNVAALQDQMRYEEDTPLTLGETFNMYARYLIDGDYDTVPEHMNNTFSLIDKKITSGDWQFPHQITDNPNQLASALLLEGYGIFLEEFEGKKGYARNFVLAMEEVLTAEFPDSSLLSDVAGWIKEEKDDFSPEVIDQLEDAMTRERGPLDEVANHINAKFRQGGNASQVIDEIRRFPKPIVVDFNNVLANNIGEIVINPEAAKFIDELRTIGDIFIVTTAVPWKGVHSLLKKGGLWHRGMVLMTYPSYQFLTDRGGRQPAAVKLRTEFKDFAKQHDIPCKDLGLDGGAPSTKRVAPLFKKPFLVPIIDDTNSATIDNPGMLGIGVKEWEPILDEHHRAWRDEHNEGRPTLEDAVKIVREHYAKIDSSSIGSIGKARPRIEEQGFHLELGPEALATIVFDPITPIDVETMDIWIGMLINYEHQAEKDTQRKDWYAGSRDAYQLLIDFLNMDDVVEGEVPHPKVIPSPTETQIKSIASLYFQAVDQVGAGSLADSYGNGLRLGLFDILGKFGQIRAAYRNDNITENTLFPRNVYSAPGFKTFLRERGFRFVQD